MNSNPTTFRQIIGQTLSNGAVISSIEIPMIQRDYAQGRETQEVTRIRNQFIDTLYGALTESAAPIKLDFIYGNVEEGKLIPLDGQQRLTTLFLLHWYVSKRENIPAGEYNFLSQFKYKTRFSSQYFCDELVKCSPSFDEENISAWIVDQNWFMYSWEKDPTIKSMLVMIDKIHETLKNETQHLWQRLTQSINPPISFYFLALEDMGVTDTLYIKMNSRGKPLTPFEHFKAEFEKTIQGVSQDLYKEFIGKVDVEWVDMLWKHRGKDNLIDQEFMNYFRFITEMICYKHDLTIYDNDFDLANAVYGIQNLNAKENLSFLFASFDCWLVEDNEKFFESIFSKSQYENNKVCTFNEQNNLFVQCCNGYNIKHARQRDFSLNNTLFLYAVLIYLTNKRLISDTEFRERIRILRNLISNSQFEIRETRFKALLEDVTSIILHGSIIHNNGGFNNPQKEEELIKYNWRRANPNFIEDINKLEDNELLQGSTDIVDHIDPELFRTRVQNFNLLFNGVNSYTKISRALLTFGDYSQLMTFRFLLGGKNDKSWRELLRPSNQRHHFERTKNVLQQLLDYLTDDFDIKLSERIKHYIENPETVKDWRYYFVKYHQMRSGISGCYNWYHDPERRKEHEYQVYMMNTPSSLNGRHWNPFLYVLSKSESLKEHVYLPEFGNLMTLLKSNQSIECKNSHWLIKSKGDDEGIKVMIDQENGIDTEDRIEKAINYLNGMI